MKWDEQVWAHKCSGQVRVSVLIFFSESCHLLKDKFENSFRMPNYTTLPVNTVRSIAVTCYTSEPSTCFYSMMLPLCFE